MADPHQPTLGVDEAGRGAVLGPLVVAACALTAAQEAHLRAAGVADSKGFGAPPRAQVRRAELADLIRQHACWCGVVMATPGEVDASVRRCQLNALERALAERLLADAPRGCRVVMDGQRVFGPLCRRLPGAVALDKADQHEIAVSAASILAKSIRDQRFAEIRARYEPALGPMGGEGYPNAATARFLEAHVARYGELPAETRRSWRWPPLARFTTARDRGEPPTLDLE